MGLCSLKEKKSERKKGIKKERERKKKRKKRDRKKNLLLNPSWWCFFTVVWLKCWQGKD